MRFDAALIGVLVRFDVALVGALARFDVTLVGALGFCFETPAFAFRWRPSDATVGKGWCSALLRAFAFGGTAPVLSPRVRSAWAQRRRLRKGAAMERGRQ